jgi:GDP-L-fucose synthase
MKNIFVAGHNGMVGSAIVRNLNNNSNVRITTRTRSELNLLSQTDVANFFKTHKFDEVYLAAAKVGGILANNTYPADFLFENLMIQSNVIHSAYISGVKKLLFLGSSCIYPKEVEQPMAESSLLKGTLEETNEPYAIAKIAGIKLCESYNRQYGVDYRSVMPTNLYGPGDNFDLMSSHVVPALIHKFHCAKVTKTSEVVVWGTGKPRREFLHVDDMSAAAIHIMNLPRSIMDAKTSPMLSHVNVGSEDDISIRDLAKLIADVTNYDGSIVYDTTKPDGTLRKKMDNSLITSLGWAPSIPLKHGLTEAYSWFLDNLPKNRLGQ